MKSLKISILVLFLLFIWMDINSTMILLQMRNTLFSQLDSKLRLTFETIKPYIRGDSIDYKVLYDFLHKYNTKKITVYSNNGKILMSVGEGTVEELNVFPDSTLFWGVRNGLFKTGKRFVLISLSNPEIAGAILRLNFSMGIKFFIYFGFILVGIILLVLRTPTKSKRTEIIDKKDNYLVNSLQELVKNYKNEIDRLKKIEQEMNEKKFLFEIGKNMSTVLHEIRNSTGTIIGYSKLLKDKELAQRILKEAFLLNRTADSLLMLSKPLLLKKTKVSISNIISSIYTPEGIILQKRVYGNDVIEGDADLLSKVFNNIIDNSIKSMNGKGKINITVRNINNRKKIRISDHGKGMNKEELSSMFDLFHTGRERGIGIGMWLTKKIVEAHGGSITVQSKKGKGTITEIIL